MPLRSEQAVVLRSSTVSKIAVTSVSDMLSRSRWMLGMICVVRLWDKHRLPALNTLADLAPGHVFLAAFYKHAIFQIWHPIKSIFCIIGLRNHRRGPGFLCEC
jgi:hypothetical protein